MLTLTRKDPETFTLVSDDQNAENIGLGEALDMAAPHLLKQFDDTEVDVDGNLSMDFPKDEWATLMEVIEAVSDQYVPTEEIMKMAAEVDQAMQHA